jgi:hypothetical protein
MVSDRRRLLLPLLGFAAMLALGVGVQRGAARRPASALYHVADEYLAEIGRGELDRALAYHGAAARTEDWIRLRARSGWQGRITAVQTSEDGRAGDVRVLWSDAQGLVRGRERLLWALEGRRGWILVGTGADG